MFSKNSSLNIGGLAIVAFWRSPHGPLGSGPPRAGYLQRRKRKEKGRFNIFATAGLRTQSVPGPEGSANQLHQDGDRFFCVPQQVLLERTNFHLSPNSFENVILCSLQYILTNPMNPFVHTIWSVSYIAQCPVWFWACQRLS